MLLAGCMMLELEHTLVSAKKPFATDSNRPTKARRAAGEHGQLSWQRLTDKPAMRSVRVARELKRRARANVWLRCMRPDQMVSNERLLPNDS